MLIVIESPNKVASIREYSGAKVMATVGHFRDLPEKELGVDRTSLEPKFVNLKHGADICTRLKAQAQGQDVIIASDPDREGFAIGVHIYEQVKGVARSIRRAEIREITHDGVAKALKAAVPFSQVNMADYDAFLGRRVGDRLVGYPLSSLARNKLGSTDPSYSVGRVQSVALFLIVQREREIKAFKPVPYWDAYLLFEKDGVKFKAESLGNPYKSRAEAEAAVSRAMAAGVAVVSELKKEQKKQNPRAPFTTVDMLSAASAYLKMATERTQKVAQELFEAGLVTYIRTDSTRLAGEFVEPLRSFIETCQGTNYLPAKAVAYKSKTSQAEAHEAIRPTEVYPVSELPALVKAKGLGEDHARLLELIWRRTVACQMSPALWDTVVAILDCGGEKFRAAGKSLRFDGFLKVWTYTEAKEAVLPVLVEQEQLAPAPLVEEKQTKPPGRFSEASLNTELEKRGIGRPSTYVQIAKTLKFRQYVELKKEQYHPTSRGFSLIEWLEKDHPWVVDCEFTAAMEARLDDIAEGKARWKDFARELISRIGGEDAVFSDGGALSVSPKQREFAQKLAGEFGLEVPRDDSQIRAFIDELVAKKNQQPLSEKQAAVIRDHGDDKVKASLEAGNYAACREWLNKHLSRPGAKDKGAGKSRAGSSGRTTRGSTSHRTATRPAR